MSRKTTLERRNEAIAVRVSQGATAEQIRDEFKLSTRRAQQLHAGVRAYVETKPRTHKSLKASKGHREALEEVQRHLGKGWLAARLGVEVGHLTDEQELEIQTLHAALRFVLLDADVLVPVVQQRLAELRRSELEGFIARQAE